MEIYRSKVDIWLFAVIALSIAIVIVSLFMTINRWSGQNIISAVVVLLVSAGFPGWVLMGTYYQVSEQLLKIRSGPFKWEIPIVEISGIAESREASASPALSLDRLKISYGANRHVLVSPKDSAGFTRALVHINPNISIGRR